jgi:hypothetical protein
MTNATLPPLSPSDAQACAAAWSQSESLRNEFRNDRDAYTSYCRATLSGASRILGPASKDGDDAAPKSFAGCLTRRAAEIAEARG